MKDRTTQSDPWGYGIDVKRLADRLDELADYVTQGLDCVRRNFVMRVPAEPYHDADLVIGTAARLLRDGLVTPPSPAQPAAQPVNLAELRDPDFSDRLTPIQHLDVVHGGADPRVAATPAQVQGVSEDRYEFSVVDSDDCEVTGGSAPTLDDAIREGRNYLAQYNQDGPHKLELRRVLVLDHSEAATHA